MERSVCHPSSSMCVGASNASCHDPTWNWSKILGSLRTIVAAGFFRCLFRDSTSGITLRHCFFRGWAHCGGTNSRYAALPRPSAVKQTSSVMCNCRWYWYWSVSLWHQARAHPTEQRLASPGFLYVACRLPSAVHFAVGVTYVRHTPLQ